MIEISEYTLRVSFVKFSEFCKTYPTSIFNSTHQENINTLFEDYFYLVFLLRDLYNDLHFFLFALIFIIGIGFIGIFWINKNLYDKKITLVKLDIITIGFV